MPSPHTGENSIVCRDCQPASPPCSLLRSIRSVQSHHGTGLLYCTTRNPSSQAPGSHPSPTGPQLLSSASRLSGKPYEVGMFGMLQAVHNQACRRRTTTSRRDAYAQCRSQDPTGLVWLGAGLIYRGLLCSCLTPLRPRATKERRRLQPPAHRILCTYLTRDKAGQGHERGLVMTVRYITASSNAPCHHTTRHQVAHRANFPEAVVLAPHL